MTPDEARRLLKNTTPGPWEWVDGKDNDVEYEALRGHGGVNALRTQDAEEYASWVRGTTADKALTAAAPVLAAMIAGMTVEYGVHWPATDDFPAWTAWGFDTIEKAREHNREMTVPPETPGTILRRYVTEPEEA